MSSSCHADGTKKKDDFMSDVSYIGTFFLGYIYSSLKLGCIYNKIKKIYGMLATGSSSHRETITC